VPFPGPVRHILARICRNPQRRDLTQYELAVCLQNTGAFRNGDYGSEIVTNEVQELPVFTLSDTALASLDQDAGVGILYSLPEIEYQSFVQHT